LTRHPFEIPNAVRLFQISEMDIFKTRMLCRACIARSYATQQRKGNGCAGNSPTRSDDDPKNQEEFESTGIGLGIKVPDYGF